MSLERLGQEIKNDPLNRGYSGMSNTQILESLRTPDRPAGTYNVLSSAELLAWAGSNQRKRKLRAASNDHASDDIKNIAEIAVDMLNRDATELDLNKADRVAMMNALVAGGVLAAEDTAALYALAAKPNVSRLQELGLGHFLEGDVEWARTH
jgi:hypothetical protein